MSCKMSITVELLAGTDLREAITEAKKMASRLNLAYAKFSFNGKSFCIGENASVEKAVSQYHSDFGSSTTIIEP